jgi:lantibiotic modifying enzyme
MSVHEINFFFQQIIYFISFKIIVHYFIAKATGYDRKTNYWVIRKITADIYSSLLQKC